jgi:hypothetical protein
MTPFALPDILHHLGRTPRILEVLLNDLPEPFIRCNEGPETWSAFDVVGHLVHGENTDWLTRIEIILSDKEDRRFAKFDRFAQYEESKGKDIHQLLREFRVARERNLSAVRSKNLGEDDLKKTGIHPTFGEVTLRQLMSTWAVHDFNHLAQIERVLAAQYKSDVGPWAEYLRILNYGR